MQYSLGIDIGSTTVKTVLIGDGTVLYERYERHMSQVRTKTWELLEEMRVSTANQIRKEDVIRRLAQLAFGRANDAVSFALHPEKAEPDAMDLSAVAEFKVTDKGVEVKLIDRLKALELLYGLLGSDDESGAEELYRALEDAAGQLEGGWEND